MNGTFDMTFAIYDHQAGGTLLYTEAHTGVVVTDGEFSVEIGSVSPLDLPFDQPYFLGIKVGDDAEMTPRTPIPAC